MQCTQRLDCLTQELTENPRERTANEQIGFLGICGQKYPVIKGPNKIGRDPQTCNIVLESNSISRQHAVINILNSREFMIMDLDSANKTKLLNKTLNPYIPQPLRNGDTVQFGQVFGIFRLLVEDDDLPMTQALDIPDTPVVNRHITKFNNLPSTMIPESPDCSDKDESIIVSSQNKSSDEFKSPNSHYIRPGKTIAIQPVGTNKIDNIFWKSSKNSVSVNMSLDDSNEGNIDGAKSNEKEIEDNIYEMETQEPFPTEKHPVSDAIFTANTQLATNSPSISDIDRHPTKMHLPNAQKIDEQHEMELDLFTDNKENNNSIHNAETQAYVPKNIVPKKQSMNNSVQRPNEESSSSKLNISDEEIIFDEVDSEPLAEDFESQRLLPSDPFNFDNDTHADDGNTEKDIKTKSCYEATNRKRLNSDSSTDCEDFDMLPTQKIQEKPMCTEKSGIDKSLSKSNSNINNINDDSTDCEDNVMENTNKVVPKMPAYIAKDDNDSTDCEDDIIPRNSVAKRDVSDVEFEDLATQIISEDKPNNIDNVNNKSETDLHFEDIPTQVIEEFDVQNAYKSVQPILLEDLPIQVITVEASKTFKVPLHLSKKTKKKEVQKPEELNSSLIEDENYYAATQEIVNDLCSQIEPSKDQDQLNISKNNRLIVSMSSESSDGDDKVNKFVTSLSNSQIKDMIGVDKKKNVNVKNVSSDSSDVECTPKKVRPIRFMETELPNSQEIKKTVTSKSQRPIVEIASDSDTENDVEEQYTSVVARKSKSRKNPKIDLTKKFEMESMPTRVLSRVRVPTEKFLNSNINHLSKTRLLTGPEDNIDKDIITENILRLKTRTSAPKVEEDNKKSKVKRSNELLNTKQASAKSYPSTSRDSNENLRDNEKSKKEIKETKTNELTKNRNSSKERTTKKQDDKGDVSKKKDEKTVVREKEEKSEEKLRSTSRRAQRRKQSNQADINKGIPSEPERKDPTRVKADKVDTKDLTKDKTNSSTTISKTSRNRQKKEDKIDDLKSTKDKKEATDKRDRRKRNIEDRSKNDPSPEVVRRSKRQKTAQNRTEDTLIQNPKPSKSNSRTSKREESTVYSMSLESGVDSPKDSIKRPVSSELQVLKRRSGSNSRNTTTRATPRNLKTHKVLFTAFPCEEVKAKLEKLGAVIVNEVAECTVLLTLQIKRTFKLLCAVGLGKPIVGPTWVQACADTNIIVDPWLYIMKDEETEKRFHFNLERTLIGKRNFLKGYNISSTPSVLPRAEEMKLIVECSGGTWKEGGSKWVCITSGSDKSLWLSLKRKGATLVSTEFILEGVLRQKLDIEKYKLG